MTVVLPLHVGLCNAAQLLYELQVEQPGSGLGHGEMVPYVKFNVPRLVPKAFTRIASAVVVAPWIATFSVTGALRSSPLK